MFGFSGELLIPAVYIFLLPLAEPGYVHDQVAMQSGKKKFKFETCDPIPHFTPFRSIVLGPKGAQIMALVEGAPTYHVHAPSYILGSGVL